jgi:hypothetical protein
LVKQSLKLSNFSGHSANAVRGQVYTPLPVYVRLRLKAFLSDWTHTQHAALCGVVLSGLETRRPA